MTTTRLERSRPRASDTAYRDLGRATASQSKSREVERSLLASICSFCGMGLVNLALYKPKSDLVLRNEALSERGSDKFPLKPKWALATDGSFPGTLRPECTERKGCCYCNGFAIAIRVGMRNLF